MDQEADCSNVDKCSLLEGLFAFFFSNERKSYNGDDVRWFLNFVNGRSVSEATVGENASTEVTPV